MSLATVARPDYARTQRLKQAALALLPLALILLWTCVVRLPFYTETDKDEFFFSVIASEWARGGLPYVATFDIKPPGLFFLFLIPQQIFGASQATFKVMEIVAVALATYGMYAIARAWGTERMARWIAILFPLYTLTLGGAIAVNIILQLPFIVAAFAAGLAAVRDDVDLGQGARNAFLAGFAIGFAGMMKQTAIFECIALFSALCLYAGRRRIVPLAASYAVGAALPALSFAAYFALEGHFHEMFNAVVTLAAERTDPDVLAVYGPDLAYNFTLLGIFSNTLLSSTPLVLLWGGAAFVVARLPQVRPLVSPKLLGFAGLWLGAAFAGAMAGRGLCTYYLLTCVPPLLILAGAFFCHGLSIRPGQEMRAFAGTIVVAVLTIAVADHENLFTPNAFLAGDYDATTKVANDIKALNPGADDRLLVLNRGFAVFEETGLFPPTPYFHATHLLGVFHTPSPDPLGESLAANPRFIVIADPTIWHITELRSRIDQALAYVARHYRVAAVVNGARDSYTLYEFRG